MKKVFAAVLAIIMLFSLCACGAQSQEEKARVNMLKIIDQFLDYKITIAQATEKLESMYIPSDTAEGYAMTKYKDSILSSLKYEWLDNLKDTRDHLVDFEKNKESDYYYQKFQEQFRNNENFIDYDAFMIDFNDLLSALPEYHTVQLSDLEGDFGSFTHIYTIDSTITDESIRLSIEKDKDNKITWVHLTSDLDAESRMLFKTFAAGVYISMGFEYGDSDSFYEKYGLLSTGEIYEKVTIGDYTIMSYTVEGINEIVFTIRVF